MTISRPGSDLLSLLDAGAIRPARAELEDTTLKDIEFRRRPLLGVGAIALLAGKAWAQQVPTPTTPAEVPGPPPGTDLTTAYVEAVGRAAYVWGWPLVNNANRHAAFSHAPEPGLLGGVLPVAHNGLAMLTNYVSPAQRFVTCTNQDVVYGFGFLDNLDGKPVVFQVVLPRLTCCRCAGE
jgi:hypothetical protein